MDNYIFDRLAYYIPKLPINIEENTFYIENATLFNQKTRFFVDTYLPSLLIQSDIVLHSLKNKEFIDEDIETYTYEQLQKPFLAKSIYERLTYFIFEGVKIYIPTYDKETNLLLQTNLASFKKENSKYVKDKNYKVINPFEYYKNEIFKTKFTRLIELETKYKKKEFFYHSELSTLFIIENGHIENELPLLPKKEPGVNFFERLNSIAKGYFNLGKNDFLDLLLKTNFIPLSIYKEVVKELSKK